MKAIIGCDSGRLLPGDQIAGAEGHRMTVLCKIPETEALKAAERLGAKIEPVSNEHWYEVNIHLRGETKMAKTRGLKIFQVF